MWKNSLACAKVFMADYQSEEQLLQPAAVTKVVHVELVK